jgi:hypothetical protein
VRQDISPPTTERTSILLKQLLAKLPEEDVSIGFIVLQMRRRSFGGIFIVLAALGLLPGISFFAGLAMLVPAFQMALGFRAPLLPRFIRQRRIGVTVVRTLGNRVIPWIEKAERYIKPRWIPLTLPPVPMIIGVITIGLAFIVMLPLPFSNLPPALALICFSLGLLERDGMMIGFGLILATTALVVGGVVAMIASEALLLLVKHPPDWSYA